MDWHLSLGDLLQGTLSAVIGLCGAVLAAYLLIRHERRLALAATNRSARDAVNEANSQAAARVISAATELLVEMIRPQVLVGRSRVKMAEALTWFHGQTAASHPQVAAWAVTRGNEAIRLAGKTTRYYLMPTGRRHRRQAAEELGGLMAALASWGAGNLEDAWFEQQLTSE